MNIKCSEFYILLLTLFTVCLIVDSSQFCPPPDRITPCNCNSFCDECSIALVCRNLRNHDILSRIVNQTNGYQYEFFEIDTSNIAHIPASLFEILKIRNLKVWSTTMTTLFDRPPSTDLANVFISLYGVGLSSMKWEMFSGIKNLKRLSIRDSLIPHFNSSFSNNVPKNLNEFIVYNCSTETLDDQIFSPFGNLLELRMEVGKIKQLKRSMFTSPSKLQLISFSVNEIESLPNDIFFDMPYLENVYLRENRLTQLNENIFRPLLPSLRAFKISENPLICGCDLRWITEIEKGRWTNIYYVGLCEGPMEMKGKSLKNLAAADFANCS
ncbi:hypothetical protein NPIL_637701 [Nephila pilipes]|uniref:LRRCT domain-containing protein n=1 Tax=Nephila pilipes TaxID=299642 RepID=A0A8X6PZD5_NEPPI|nr:hypothetical protein NPIL_637701 [Nephila pilipes]